MAHRNLATMLITSALSLTCTSVLAAGDNGGMSISTNLPMMKENHLCADLMKAETYIDPKMASYRYLFMGKNGYVFRSSSDLDPKYKIDNEGVQNFVRLRDVLAKNGTTLILAFIPSRGIALQYHLDETNPYVKAFDAQGALADYKIMVKKLKDAGVPIATITDFSGFTEEEPFGYKLDHHWTYFGARAVAQDVARIVKTLPVYADLPKQEFTTETKEKIDYLGAFSMRIRNSCKEQPQPEVAYRRLTSPKGTKESDLIGDAAIPQTVLVGTSNSTAGDSFANFEGSLKEFLGTDVMNMAIAGAGADGPMLDYLGSKAYRTQKPKLLIWEIPSYYRMTSKSGLGPVFREFIPAAADTCKDSAVILQDEQVIGTKPVDLFNDISVKNIMGGTHMISLTFEKTVQQDAVLTIKAGDEDLIYKFERSNVNAQNIILDAILPTPKNGSAISSISLRAPKLSVGTKVSARICATP
jgi:alginate biosynthesis protein AlgX